MAKKNKNITNLVAAEDDDQTAELEVGALRRAFDIGDADLEADADTFDIANFAGEIQDGISVADLQSENKVRSETIERLQFDIEQLRAKWMGLEAEIKSREELTVSLTTQLKTAQRQLARKKKLLEKSDQSNSVLKAEIRERDSALQSLQLLADEYLAERNELLAGDEVNALRLQHAEITGQLASHAESLRESQAQQRRTEQYADQLRQQLDDITDESQRAIDEQIKLRESEAAAVARMEALEAQQLESGKRIRELERAIQEASRQHAQAIEETSRQHAQAIEETSRQHAQANQEASRQHEQEIKTLRFELGEAAGTITESKQLNEELVSDLLNTRGSTEKLKSLLTAQEASSAERIDALEKALAKQQGVIEDYEYKLQKKSDAINCLLAELAKKSKEIDSIGEMEDVIQEIDDRMSERIDDRSKTGNDRVTRLLVGSFADKELRFPLFKDRLTIGRTQQNDIQLEAQYISRRHAVIATEGDATRIIDWGSRNGVYVNSNRVSEHFLKNGDIVTIGTASFRYEERPKRDS